MKLSILLALIPLIQSFPIFDNQIQLFGGEPDRVIKVGPKEYKLVNEEQKLTLKRNNIKFIDVTNSINVKQAFEEGLLENVPTGFNIQLLGSKFLSDIAPPKNYTYPETISYKSDVKDFISKIDTDKMYENLSKFTSFYTRYYKSETGYESAQWLEGKLQEIIAPVKDVVNLSRVNHEGWDQFSIIASIPGKVDSKVIVGAHQDSVNLLFPSLMRSPGADDDGSGTVTILEAFRILMDSYVKGDFKPHHTLEFHFYSAEEGGLLGSFDVYQKYYQQKETVVGLLQQDMTGYTGNMKEGEIHMGLITDYTSSGLNDFIRVIVDNYCSIPYHETSCGYACSDHASAIEHGFPASFVIESEFAYSSKFIHSVYDTIDRIDWDHVKEHTKLTLGFAYELSMAKVDTDI